MGMKHTTQATGTNDAGKQVSKNVWNEDHTIDISLNFPPQASDPASPANGDMWATTGGDLKVRLAGSTAIVGQLAKATQTWSGINIFTGSAPTAYCDFQSPAYFVDGANGFLIYNLADDTKAGVFNAGNITTGTVRTYNLPNADGTLALVATTLAGYGITDAVDLASNQSVAGVKTFTDPFVLSNETAPPASNADGSLWFDSLLKRINTTFGTRKRELSPEIYASGFFGAAAAANGTTVAVIGAAAPTATGTATAAGVSTTNAYARLRKLEYLVTTAATTAVAGWRTGSTYFTVGGASADVGGFLATIIAGFATGMTTSTRRGFIGIASATAAPTDVDPSTQVNCAGIGFDNGDTNLQFMHNDASGTATKIDLGASFPKPSADRTNDYKLELYSPKGTTQSITYRVTNLATGAVATGTVTTNLPSTSTLIALRGWASVGGTSSVIGVSLTGYNIDPLDGVTF